MNLPESILSDIKCIVEGWRESSDTERTVRKYRQQEFSWPAAKARDMVFKADTAVELGAPDQESVSFVAWTHNSCLVEDGSITVVGPDLSEETRDSLAFGKVVFAGVSGFTEDNCCGRLREMDLARFRVRLKGYMMRAVSQYMREWSRVSRKALESGFTFTILGSAMLEEIKRLEYVTDAELLFITSSPGDVRTLKPSRDRLTAYTGAMAKMTEEQEADCNQCQYRDICGETEELRIMKQKLENKKRAGK